MSAPKSLFGNLQRQRDSYIFGTTKEPEDIYVAGIVIDVITQYLESKNKELKNVDKGIELLILVHDSSNKRHIKANVPISDSLEEILGHYGSVGNLIGRRVVLQTKGLSSIALSKAILTFNEASFEELEYTDKYIPVSIASLGGQSFNMRERNESFVRPANESAGSIWLLR